MDKDYELSLEKFFEDELNLAVNEYLREINNDLKQYDLSKIVENELDFIVGMAVNEILNKFSAFVTKNNRKLASEEKEIFYRNIAMIDLRHTVRRLIEV